ncbi:MAG: hypothetical protein IKM30_05510 [Oscillospiraceae bacterium]|nr:hypothetical protein [Oscillospiraceae bacterium]
MLPASTALLFSAEYWRYFLTGLSVAVLFGVGCHTLGRFLLPFGQWRSFCASCLSAQPTEQGTILVVEFFDRNRLRHQAALLTDHPAAKNIETDMPIRIAIRTESFVSGTYPDLQPESSDCRTVYLAAEQKSLLRRALLRVAATGLPACAVAFLVFYAAMQICFP